MKLPLLLALALLSIPGCTRQATPDACSSCAGEETTDTASSQPTPDLEEVAVAEPEATTASIALADAYAAYEAGELYLVDVNSEGVREELGYIPNAIRVSSYQFAPAELAGYEDAALVFYCVNPQCVAGRLAADYAESLGFSDVRHMPAGVMGWRAAGYEVAYPTD